MLRQLANIGSNSSSDSPSRTQSNLFCVHVTVCCTHVTVCCVHVTLCCVHVTMCCVHVTVCCVQVAMCCVHVTLCCVHVTMYCVYVTVCCVQVTMCCVHVTMCCVHVTVCCVQEPGGEDGQRWAVELGWCHWLPPQRANLPCPRTGVRIQGPLRKLQGIFQHPGPSTPTLR